MERKSKKEYAEDNIAKSVKKRQGKKRKQQNNNVLMLMLGLVLGIIIGVMGTIIVYDRNESEISTKEVGQQLAEDTSYMDEVLNEKGFAIETPMVNLYYPEKWNDYIRVEQIEADFHTVQFFATIEEKNEIHLFDILLGGETGYLLGYLKGENNDKIPVNIVSYDLELGEEWTSEEESLIYAMFEDVNYIVGMLQKEADFEQAQ